MDRRLSDMNGEDDGERMSGEREGEEVDLEGDGSKSSGGGQRGLRGGDGAGNSTTNANASSIANVSPHGSASILQGLGVDARSERDGDGNSYKSNNNARSSSIINGNTSGGSAVINNSSIATTTANNYNTTTTPNTTIMSSSGPSSNVNPPNSLPRIPQITHSKTYPLYGATGAGEWAASLSVPQGVGLGQSQQHRQGSVTRTAVGLQNTFSDAFMEGERLDEGEDGGGATVVARGVRGETPGIVSQGLVSEAEAEALFGL